MVTHAKEVAEVIRKKVPELNYIASRGRGWASSEPLPVVDLFR